MFCIKFLNLLDFCIMLGCSSFR